jgi:hypothetical protein
MVDPSVTLDPARAAVEPGGQARITVTVTNPGTIVEGYRIEVLGEAAAWSEVTPAEVSVYPQQSETAVIIFSPPAGSAVSGGSLGFGVRARSTVDADASAVAEGDLDVGQVVGLQAKITPVTSAGRWRGYHNVWFTNWGNSAARLKVTVTDPDEKLGFLVRPPVVEVPLGGSAKVSITVRARKPFLRGNPVRLPFQVVGEREDAGPQTGPVQPYADPGRPVIDAALNQKPILTRMVMIIGGLLLAAVAAGIVYLATRPDPPPALPDSVPPRPELIAVATGPDTVRLTWTKIDQIQGYTLFTVDPQSKRTFASQSIGADLQQYQVSDLKPKTQHCYQLQAVRPKFPSVRSELACATTAAAAATASPSTGSPASSAPPSTTTSSAPGGGSGSSGNTGTGGNGPANSTSPSAGQSVPPSAQPSGALPAGSWIAAARFSMAQDDIDNVITVLAQHGVRADWLDGSRYPRMIMDGGTPFQWPGPVAYVGPFGTPAEASAACATIDPLLADQPPVGQSCQVLQPGQQQ